MDNDKVYRMEYPKIYQAVVNKAMKKGRTCEEVEEPLMREICYLDKLVDELAKGKAMDKILR